MAMSNARQNTVPEAVNSSIFDKSSPVKKSIKAQNNTTYFLFSMD